METGVAIVQLQIIVIAVVRSNSQIAENDNNSFVESTELRRYEDMKAANTSKLILHSARVETGQNFTKQQGCLYKS